MEKNEWAQVILIRNRPEKFNKGIGMYKFSTGLEFPSEFPCLFSQFIIIFYAPSSPVESGEGAELGAHPQISQRVRDDGHAATQVTAHRYHVHGRSYA